MTIGNGLIANGIQLSSNNINQYLLFASGVSNSNETDPTEFNREKKLLLDAIKRHKSQTFVYFSSCDVEDPFDNKIYYTHKLAMEEIVKSSVNSYYIFRLPQAVGKTSNKNTLFNFLVDRITHHIPFDVWTHATRNLIDIDDINQIVNYIINKKIFFNSTINIASLRNYPILELVNRIEHFLGEKAIYNEIPKGHEYKIDTSTIKKILLELNLTFDESYLDRLIHKYIHSKNEDKHDQ